MWYKKSNLFSTLTKKTLISKTLCKKHDSLGAILFDLKEAGPFSWAGQNTRTKSAIKPIIFYRMWFSRCYSDCTIHCNLYYGCSSTPSHIFFIIHHLDWNVWSSKHICREEKYLVGHKPKSKVFRHAYINDKI